MLWTAQSINYTSSLCLVSEEVINRIIALMKEQGDAIDVKVGINCQSWKSKNIEILYVK